MGGGRFTYMALNGSSLSKIDRFLVSADFINLWPEASVTVLPRRFSDHRPLLLKCKSLDFGPIPFKCFDSWLDKPGFVDVVINSYREAAVFGAPDRRFVLKLKAVKKAIKEWRQKVKNEELGKINTLREDIDNLDKLAEIRQLTGDELKDRSCWLKELVELEDALSRDLKQKARVKWLRDGDENTSFFHGSIKSNVCRTRVNGLMKNGVWITDPVVVKSEFFKHFEDRFHEPVVERPHFINNNFKRLSSQSADSLIAEFSMNEIKSAVWNCGGEKSPGPDGFNFNFVKRFWDLMAEDLLEVLKFYHAGGEISVGCNASFIALIPKINEPTLIAEYRPISLIGCLYKIYSKVLANRLKVVIPEVVGIEQSAFLQGRVILEGPLLVNEVVSWVKKRKSKAMLFKVDFEKAYDMVNWKFLDSVMCQMGFPSIWRGWIRSCVSSAKASVLINGSPTGEFIASRGLRQGDPLSPFLFTLVMEALSVSIRMASSCGIFHGIRLPNGGPVITHCMYADDTLFLEEEMMLNVLKCKSGKVPFKHLGVPVGENLNRIKSWDPVVEKFKGKLSNWKAKTLSFGGRLTLVKSVLGSLPIYFMSLFKMPSTVVRKLEGMRRDFLWGGSLDKRSIPWVKWESVMAPREAGGLGVGSIRDLNVALLTKWKWLFKVNPTALWVKVVKAVHWQPRKKTQFPSNKSLGSPWNIIISVDEVLKSENIDTNKLLKATVGVDSSVLFWWDWWIGPSPLKEMFPDLFMLEKHKMCKVAEKRVTLEGGSNWRWDWIRFPALGPETMQFQQCFMLLQGFESIDGPDKWRWEASDDGLFSVKSLRQILELNRVPVDLNPVKWSNWIPLKVRCFSWKARLNKIPAKTALARRGVQVGTEECSMCFNHLESPDHALLHCFFAAKVWEKIFEWCGWDGATGDTIRDRIDCHNNLNGSEKLKEKAAVIVMATVWFIWLARNDFIFNSSPLCADRVMEKIRVYSFMWLKHRAFRLDVMWHRWFVSPLV